MGSMAQSTTIERINAEEWKAFFALDNWADRIEFLLAHQSLNMAVPISMPAQFMRDLAAELKASGI